MAKEIILEISWLRPLKLIGLANLFCALIAFIFSMALKDWVISDDNKDLQFYMGLWEQCTKLPPPRKNIANDYDDVTTPVEDEPESDWNCEAASNRGTYVSITQALIVIPFIAAIVCFVIGVIAYCKREWRFLYKIAAIILIIAAVTVLVAVILFPAKFLDDLPFYVFFWFGWGYGLAWAAFCFMLTAAILFLISHDRKEIYRTEKRVVV